jgi:orotate phosphoribosyltransferase
MDAMRIIIETGAKKEGHFVLTSDDKHTEYYLDKDAIYLHPVKTSLLARKIAEQYRDSGVEVVIGPAMGGIILSQWVAYWLSKITGVEVLAVYAKKNENDKDFIIKRGYEKVINGKRILVVEDTLTTGGSVKKVVILVRAFGGEVVGVGAIGNRGGVTMAQIANPPRLTALINVEFKTWAEEDCPLCVQGIPVDANVGKGREYLLKKEEK